MDYNRMCHFNEELQGDCVDWELSKIISIKTLLHWHIGLKSTHSKSKQLRGKLMWIKYII